MLLKGRNLWWHSTQQFCDIHPPWKICFGSPFYPFTSLALVNRSSLDSSAASNAQLPQWCTSCKLKLMLGPVSSTPRLIMFFISTPANMKGRTELFVSATYPTTQNYSFLWRKQYNLVESPQSWGMRNNGSSVACKLGFKILRCYQIETNKARFSSSKQFWVTSSGGQEIIRSPQKRRFTVARKKFPKSTPQCILTSLGQGVPRGAFDESGQQSGQQRTKSYWWLNPCCFFKFIYRPIINFSFHNYMESIKVQM